MRKFLVFLQWLSCGYRVAIVWLSCGYRVVIEWLSSGYRAEVYNRSRAFEMRFSILLALSPLTFAHDLQGPCQLGYLPFPANMNLAHP